MNIQQLRYINNSSAKRLVELEQIYGYINIHETKNMLLISIAKDVLDESGWYELNPTTYNEVLEFVSSLFRESKVSLVEVPTDEIYSSFNDPQTSYTYDDLTI